MKTLITLLIILLTSSSLNGRTKNDSVKVKIHRMDSLERYAELFEESVKLVEMCLNSPEFKERLLASDMKECNRRFYDQTDEKVIVEKKTSSQDIFNILFEAKEVCTLEAVPDTIYPGNRFGKCLDYPKTWIHGFAEENKQYVIDLRFRLRPDADKPSASTAAWVQGEGVINLVDSYMVRTLDRYENGNKIFALKDFCDTIIHEYMHILTYHHHEKETSKSVPYTVATIVGDLVKEHLTNNEVASN